MRTFKNLLNTLSNPKNINAFTEARNTLAAMAITHNEVKTLSYPVQLEFYKNDLEYISIEAGEARDHNKAAFQFMLKEGFSIKELNLMAASI